MPRYTKAYSSYIQRMEEVEILRQQAAVKERINPIAHKNEINALCRGSLVLLCAHLEAYIKELGEIALDSLYSKNVTRTTISPLIYYHISKNYIDDIKDTPHPEKIAEKVFDFLTHDLGYWSNVGPFPQTIEVERFNKGFANPSFNKIKAYFNRFGYSDYKQELANRLKAQYLPIVTMIDHLVDIRNKIAHGDPAATETPSDIKVIIELIRLYCKTTDAVFAAWWRANFCSIR